MDRFTPEASPPPGQNPDIEPSYSNLAIEKHADYTAWMSQIEDDIKTCFATEVRYCTEEFTKICAQHGHTLWDNLKVKNLVSNYLTYHREIVDRKCRENDELIRVHGTGITDEEGGKLDVQRAAKLETLQILARELAIEYEQEMERKMEHESEEEELAREITQKAEKHEVGVHWGENCVQQIVDITIRAKWHVHLYKELFNPIWRVPMEGGYG